MVDCLLRSQKFDECISVVCQSRLGLNWDSYQQPYRKTRFVFHQATMRDFDTRATWSHE